MRTTRILKVPLLAAALALFGLFGCKDQSEKAAEKVHNEAEDVRKQANEVGKEVRQYGKEVRELKAADRTAWQQAAKDGNYTVDFTADGGVVASRQQPAAQAPSAGSAAPSDSDLESAAKTRFSQSPTAALRGINATAKNGVVTLHGKVPTIREAEEAVNEALKTPGVTKVISYIDYGA